MQLDAVPASIYMNPTSTSVTWVVSLSGNMAGSGNTWTDPSPEIRPDTTYTGHAAVSNVAGWSDWGADCGPRTTSAPWVGTPSISSSNVAGSSTVSWSWSQPTNGNYYQLVNSSYSNRYTGTSRSNSAYNQPWGVPECGRVHAAYSSRLAGWGIWGGWSGLACETPVDLSPKFGTCVANSAVANFDGGLGALQYYSTVWLGWCGSSTVDYWHITWVAYDQYGSPVAPIVSKDVNESFAGTGSAFSPSSYSTFTGKQYATNVTFTIQGFARGPAPLYALLSTSMLTRSDTM